MSISNEAVEAFARAFHHDWEYHTQEPWRSMGLERIRTALEAAAPHMLARAWAAGHESGFWNGRESTGSGEMEFCGVEHAKANNPYKGTNE